MQAPQQQGDIASQLQDDKPATHRKSFACRFGMTSRAATGGMGRQDPAIDAYF
jgi:hypothetical protein